MQYEGFIAEGAAARRLGDPWKELSDTGRGYLSVYYSEPLARWPIREITRPGDNKSDPNIETGTYGLFSTCEPKMRNRIVHDGAATVFFLTKRKKHQGRVVSGYYHVGWYTEGTQGAVNHDYALAAKTMRFIDPILAAELPEPLATICNAWFRTIKRMDVEATAQLRNLCDQLPGRTSKYLSEVARIETFARARSGYAYPSWGRENGFSWDDAADYYQKDAKSVKVPNSSKNHKWRCRGCDYVIKNSALLKRCPLCKQIATLVPAREDA